MGQGSGSLPHLAAGIPAGKGDFLVARRYRLVERYLPTSGGTLLDFGCGNGAQTFSFVDHFSRVIGVDIDPRFLAEFRTQAVERQEGENIVTVRFDGSSLPLANATVDVGISFTVLEHLADETRVLEELARVVKPSGTLIVSVPNRWWIFETHGANLPLLPWNRVPFVSWWPRKLHDRFARARIYELKEVVGKVAAVGFDIVHSDYLTAPMDVLRWKPLQRLLRRYIFRHDSTRIPCLATEIVVVARRR